MKTLACALYIAALLLLRATASAHDFFIPSGNVAFLKTAIIFANINNEDDIITLETNGTYTLTTVDNDTLGPTGLPVIKSDNGHRVTIVGNGATIQRSSASGTPAFRLLFVNKATVDISGLTLSRGGLDDLIQVIWMDGGGIYNYEGTLTLTRCTLTGNKVRGSGGALYSGNDYNLYPEEDPRNASVTLTDCILSDNEALYHGGGIASIAYWAFAELTVINCILERNSTYRGGGGINSGASDFFDGHASLDVRGCTFRANTVESYSEGYDPTGGGIESIGNATASISDSLFEGNRTLGGTDTERGMLGGAIGSDGQSLTVERCTFIGNSGTVDSRCHGGAIGSDGPSAVVSHCTFRDNRASSGGSIGNLGNMSVINCTFGDNSALRGGGISNRGEMSISNSFFSDNTAAYGGGVSNEAEMSVYNCTFRANRIESEREYEVNGGGGILNRGNIAVHHCTFSGNTGQDFGDTLWNCDNDETDSSIPQMRLSGNIFYAASPGNEIANGFIASWAPELGLLGAGVITSQGYNLASDDADGFLNQSTDQLDTDPLLDPTGPQDNGGPTPTIRLMPGSPATDRIAGVAGTDFPATDQRGTSRPQGTRADIGAFESVPISTMLTLTLGGNYARILRPFNLIATLLDADNAPLANQTITFSVDGNAVGTATTDTSGQAIFAYSAPEGSVGNHTVTTSFASAPGYAGSSDTRTLEVKPEGTSLWVTSFTATTGKTLTLKASLKAWVTARPLAGKTLTFTVNGTTVTGVTDANGIATAQYIIPADTPVGATPITVTFKGDANYLSTSRDGTLTVQAKTALYTGNRLRKSGDKITLTATLRRTPGNAVVADKTVTFMVNGAVVGTGTTDSNGIASVPYTVSLGIGSYPIEVRFEGDGLYLACVGTATFTVKP